VVPTENLLQTDPLSPWKRNGRTKGSNAVCKLSIKFSTLWKCPSSSPPVYCKNNSVRLKKKYPFVPQNKFSLCYAPFSLQAPSRLLVQQRQLWERTPQHTPGLSFFITTLLLLMGPPKLYTPHWLLPIVLLNLNTQPIQTSPHFSCLLSPLAVVLWAALPPPRTLHSPAPSRSPRLQPAQEAP